MSPTDESSSSLQTTVVIPTIGRTELLRQCLGSIFECRPAPSEVVVVDQSGDTSVINLAKALQQNVHVRVVTSRGHGTAQATNQGVRSARNRTVLVTHDDCTVESDWVGEAVLQLSIRPDAIVTGRVLPPTGAQYVPSTIEGIEPIDYTGQITSGVLYPANMAFDREVMLAFGGFDERTSLRLSEDNDLCYRWLREGRPLRFEPSLVVWHHDWRTPTQLLRTHIDYARSQGGFYAKHLLARDRHIMPLLRWDLTQALVSKVRGVTRGTPRWQDPYREMFGSLLRGLGTELWRERKQIL